MNLTVPTSVTASVIATAGLQSAASVVVIVISLVTLVGGIAGAVYGTKRSTELRASRGAADAWREERDAEKAKAERLEVALRDEAARRQSAEARTDIERIEKQIAQNHREVVAILHLITQTLTQATTAVEFLSKQQLDVSLTAPDGTAG